MKPIYFVIAAALAFALGWALGAVLVALFLNVLGGFGLSFWQAVGLAGLIQTVAVITGSNASTSK